MSLNTKIKILVKVFFFLYNKYKNRGNDMNKKGFTLVELLAVIVIMALLALITTTSITKIIGDSKTKLSTAQIDLIKSAAEIWGADNINKLPKVNECSYITLKDLINQGLVDSSIIDPKDNKSISDNLKIKISNTLTEYGKEKIEYEVNSHSTNDCKWAYPCKYTTDANGNEMVTCGTESFYVMEKTATEVTMLAQYNITLSKTNPQQDSTDIGYPSKNAISFANSVYWRGPQYQVLPGYTHIYAYDNMSNTYEYVEAYADMLDKTVVNTLDARLMSYEQIQDSSWIYLSTYWLGSSDAAGVIYVSSTGGVHFNIGLDGCSNLCGYSIPGIRPVIKISISDIG